MKLYSTTKKAKTANLKRRNWNMISENQKCVYYRHKQRKRLVLQIDNMTKLGIFIDEKRQIPISQYKIIKWQ